MAEENTHVVLTLMTDLFFETRVRSTAQAAGWKVRSVRSAEKACALAETIEPSLVVVDLAAVENETQKAIAVLLTTFPAARLIAFGSHVDAAALDAARQAGAHEVMPRSAFSAELVNLLRNDAM